LEVKEEKVFGEKSFSKNRKKFFGSKEEKVFGRRLKKRKKQERRLEKNGKISILES
jgi:hypothetical protein